MLMGATAGGEVTSLMSTRCPYLRSLRLCLTVVDGDDVSIRSGSLHSLSLRLLGTRRLEVVAPILDNLYLCNTIDDEVCVSAPKLAELAWRGAAYYPYHLHRFDGVGRCLRLLDIDIGAGSVVASLLRKFDEAHGLKLAISMPREITAYESFLNETNKMPKCKILTVSLSWNQHGSAPVVLHILRSCSSVKRVSIQLYDYSGCSSVISNLFLPF
ncbi:hypothetical protein HU200_048657 [Digitaria exilis]|uniref:Uncharacterized protein n=1 Tax=Digitaria exilis TaxID=1010633 RepID=A0A835ASG4_9POAL|nr:hypothetical protein HU200_048657 [Digitaria exilis]